MMSVIHKQTSESPLFNEPGILEDIPDSYSAIAEIAYYKAERRCFEPGHELEDWFEAEREYMREMDKYG